MNILVLGMSPELAGTETFILNYFRNINKEEIHFDFIKRTEEPIIFEDEILRQNSKIFFIPEKRGNLSQYYREMDSFFKENAENYNVIWCNVMSVTNIDFLVYAKKYGIPLRVIHSHNSKWNWEKWKYFLHIFNKKRLAKVATHYFACSNLAADYLFDKNIRNQVSIIPNAIEVEQFTFSENDRIQLREKLGWKDCKIIGNIGRLNPQKNQLFLIDVFAEAYKKDSRLRLIILGKDSELKSQIEEKIYGLGLEDIVLLPGSQTNIKAWLSAMDLFMLPSIFEGLPLSALEAQANGLPVLVSDVITTELNITNNVEYLSLKETTENWAMKILELVDKPRMNSDIIERIFKEKGYNIKYQAQNLRKTLEV